MFVREGYGPLTCSIQLMLQNSALILVRSPRPDPSVRLDYHR